jgi:hypothetical protein
MMASGRSASHPGKAAADRSRDVSDRLLRSVLAAERESEQDGTIGCRFFGRSLAFVRALFLP